MKIKHVMGATLEFEDGRTILVERLGKGQFHTCYVDRAANQVYSITIARADNGADTEDYSKEILSHPTCGVGASDNPHLPKVERLEDADANGERRVYRMPLYEPLSATKHPQQWTEFKILERLREQTWNDVYREQVTTRRMRDTDIGYMVNQTLANRIVNQVPAELCEAIQELTDGAAMYGSNYCLEFWKRNVMVATINGRYVLILLDVLFNLQAVDAIQRKRAKRYER